MAKLNGRQRRFVKAKINGATNVDAVYLAGYKPKNDKVAGVMGAKLASKVLVAEALDKAGLSDTALADTLKTAITSGLGVKASNSDAIAGIRLAHELKGNLKRETPQELNQTNIYINELRQLDDVALAAKVEQLTAAVAELQ